MKNAAVVFLLLSFFLAGCANTSSLEHSTIGEITGKNHLTSWNDGPAKKRIVSFVEEISNPASSKFMPEGKRRAVFDMDGTLLCEKPNYIEVVVSQHRLREKALANPDIRALPIYAAALRDDQTYLYNNVKEVITEAFAGQTLQFYLDYCRRFLSDMRHPRFGLSYRDMFYIPMLELIEYLQDAGFAIFVVSTSQQEFIRSLSLEKLKVVPQHVLGTMVAYKLGNLAENAPPVFIRTKDYFNPYTADENKVVRLRERAVLPAIFAFGNSMGDYAMLDAVSDSGLPNMVCILDHDDPQRAYEYHKEKLLSEAGRRQWLIVSMRRDFKTVFSGR
jgi:phosphoserine phosphatase